MIPLSSILRLGACAALPAAFSFLTAGATNPAQQSAGQTASPSVTDRELSDSVAGAMYEDLDEFVVTAEKPIIKSDGAKLTYDVEEDITSKGTTALDMLRKVPMVSVDGQDNIRINGQENFKIYVNGKEDAFLSANYQKVLKAMPAESISKVEVITDPDAKYDAEGTAGILNLITERSRKDEGYSGSLTANFSRLNAGASAFGGIKKGKVNANLNINYADNSIFSMHSSSDRMQEYLDSETQHLMHEHADMKQNWHYFGGNTALSWEPDERNLFTLSVDGTLMKAKVPGANGHAEMLDINGSKVWSYSRMLTGDFSNNSISADASYQHDFSPNGHKLILSYQYNFGTGDMNLMNDYLESHGMTFPYRFNHQSSDTYMRSHTAQADYINPFGEGKHTLETGVKGLWRHNNSYGSTSNGNSPDNLITDAAESADAIQFQDIYAAYASYTGQFGAISAKAGLRYEHTHMGANLKESTGNRFSSNLDDLVPNASLTYSFSPMHNIRAAYSMRISRPTIEQINPYQMQVETNTVRTGNPDLTSEKSHRASLTYTNFGTTVGGNIGMEYSRINNAIVSYLYLRDEILYETAANIGHSQRAALTGFLTWQIIPGMRLNVNGSAEYVDLESESPRFHNSGWTFNYGGSWDYTLPCGIALSAYGGQKTRNISLQGHSNGWYYYGIGASRDFFGKALNVSVRASQFLQANRKFRNYVNTGNLISNSTWSASQWDVGVSLTWSFGATKTKVKSTDARIDNDDKAETGSSRQGAL